jgi:chemotaxis protein methyltransferase CheR
MEKVLQGVGDEYQLCDDLRQAVEFTRVNLSEPGDTVAIATSTWSSAATC